MTNVDEASTSMGEIFKNLSRVEEYRSEDCDIGLRIFMQICYMKLLMETLKF